MSFLSIPSKEGTFTTIKNGRSAEQAGSRSHMDNEDNNDDDDDEEDDDSEDVRLIPRCSPVPRKRGHSIHDETAEYMRIQLALSGRKRVSFADTTGGDLVDVKEFAAFESDDEEDIAKWEEEEAKYRKPEREPTYHVHPEFPVPSSSALLQAVHSKKVEVEQISPVENEPLAFSGVIRVLSISFHKAVYIRSTMDNWATYFDHPAEYVQGSYDGCTDQFSFKLSFDPPYITHGSRIEFVVRYETSDGDYWANNCSMNYVVTLLLSYEDDLAQANDMQEVRGILRPPKAYSMKDDFDSEDEQEKDKEEAGTSRSGPTVVCPVIIHPEIDIEITVPPSGPCVPPNHELSSVDGKLSAHPVSPGEQFPCMSSKTPLPTTSSFVLCTSESAKPNKSQPLPILQCELGNQTSELPIDSSPCALLPASTPSLQQESGPRSNSFQAGGEEIPPSDASCMHLPAAEKDLWPTAEGGPPDSPASHPGLDLPAEGVSAPSVTQGSEREVAVGSSELGAGLSEGSTRSAADPESATPALLSPVAESQASLGAVGESPPSPEPTENARQNVAQSASAWEEKEDAAQIPPDTLLKNLPNTLSEACELQSQHDPNKILTPSIIFLSGVVSLSIVLQEPSALFLIGLLLVLHRL
ncbi:protein phosphatase 1 regulatory subunit 3F isoform X2 [Etheostoma cragini]|uniref:protein phosphatase 1 regulatory subunit 3F isoform X2 n=1 Tax=Etheostoma cragini TaxID=417921 RepID=UPI00155EE653|nr:protein phosphatase 1 regulatory subunit 3F isoform X2 [Etheostoma cragini]